MLIWLFFEVGVEASTAHEQGGSTDDWKAKALCALPATAYRRWLQQRALCIPLTLMLTIVSFRDKAALDANIHIFIMPTPDL